MKSKLVPLTLTCLIKTYARSMVEANILILKGVWLQLVMTARFTQTVVELHRKHRRALSTLR